MNESVVVLVDSRSGFSIPAAALLVLREAVAVYVGTDIDPAAFEVERAPEVDKLLAEPVVLLVSSTEEPGAAALLAAGAQLVGPSSNPRPILLVKSKVVEAIEVMDRLRSPGGCPWDAEQTHDSLRQYLIEEAYELLDAVEDRDRVALREELGDVLLQVLFHARIAAEDPEDAFDIEDVAADLVTKLITRHPHVFSKNADTEPFEGSESITPELVNQNWEKLKQAEKQRKSIMDGVALGQPAVALAGKVGQRSGRADVPLELLPQGSSPAEQLFRIAVSARRAGVDPEDELRIVAKQFIRDVRTAELAAQQAGHDLSALSADDWRKFWPHPL